jgi:DNA-binding beta-propeller fold protein YncE
MTTSPPAAGHTARPNRWTVGGLFLGLALAAGSVGGRPAAGAESDVRFLVPNFGADSVTIYARTAGGNVPPLLQLSGPTTGLSRPQSVALDRATGEIVVANFGANSITIYAGNASGDTAPLRTIVGPATGLSAPRGVAVDSVHGEIFVSNLGSVTVYDRTANGNAAPLLTLTPAPGPSGFVPLNILVDTAHDELIVANGNEVDVYRRTVNGNATPLRTLKGIATGLRKPTGLALDPALDVLFVANFDTPSITAYPRTADGDVLPLRTITGPATQLNGPLGVAVDTIHGELLVANQNPPSLTVYNKEADGNRDPIRVLAGPVTGLLGPGFFAISSPTVPRLVTGAGPGGGPQVRLFDAATGQEVIAFFAYAPGFTGGVSVAMGDVNGDGIPDVITGAGPGGGSHVQVFDGAALLKGLVVPLFSFFAYDPGFTGGVFVAAADLNGDGRADIITSAGPGGGPHVRVFDGATGGQLALPVGSFFAYDPAFTGGVFVGGAP